MPIDRITRTLTTSVDKFAVYHPTPISSKAPKNKTFFVLGERIEISHEKHHHHQASELRGARRRADSAPETISSPAILTRNVRSKSSDDSHSAETPETEETETDIEMGILKLGDSSSDYKSDDSTITVTKRFEHANWDYIQKRVFYQSFAQKPHDFPVFISKEEAIKEMQKHTVLPKGHGETMKIGSPIFKVMVTETEISGRRVYNINRITKIYFHDKCCRVNADMGQINIADRQHTEANDFLFTVDNIKDNIPPLVKISQDLKVPLILFVLTFVTQVIQIIITNYLPSNDSTSC